MRRLVTRASLLPALADAAADAAAGLTLTGAGVACALALALGFGFGDGDGDGATATAGCAFAGGFAPLEAVPEPDFGAFAPDAPESATVGVRFGRADGTRPASGCLWANELSASGFDC